MNSLPGLPRLIKRAFEVLKSDLDQIRPRQHLLSAVSKAIPCNVGNRVRASLLRSRGIHVGARTKVCGTPRLTGGEARGFSNLEVGSDCLIGIGCAFEVGTTITIGNNVTLGHEVLIITTSHELGPREHRAGKLVRSPVKIEAGAFVGPRCIILPGVTIGAGAIVEPGSVVKKDVAPHTRAHGIPARPVDGATL